jgi:Na+/H+-dicarboxylate symporter
MRAPFVTFLTPHRLAHAMERERVVHVLTGPWVTLPLLLIGLALGTWAPDLAAPFQDAVDALVTGLVLAVPFIILFTILPSLVALFSHGGGKGPLVVIGLFIVTGFAGGLFGLLVAWPLFGLSWGAAEGATAYTPTLGDIAGDLTGSRAMVAVLWSIGVALLLTTLIFLGRHRTKGPLARVAHVARETAAIFAWIGDRGVGAVGRGLRYVLPLLLFAVGTYVPAAVERATTLAEAGAGTANALPWYLGTAFIVAIVTLAYALLIAYVAARMSGTSLRRMLFTYAPPVYAFAWSTASGTATIPISMEAAKRLDTRDSTRMFVIPLGASMNLDGTMVAGMLITPVVMHVLGLPLSLGMLAATILPMVVVTHGSPGIPGGTSILAPPILAAVLGLQGDTAEAFIGVWFAFSVGLTDQFRTGANAIINGFLCLMVDRFMEGPRVLVFLEDVEPRGAGGAGGGA